jgi:cytoskeletal protein CcmA (bactofilin family)
MDFLKKVKAGALQYVLVISVIIAIIIFAFISLIYLQQRVSIKHQFAKETIANTQLVFDYLKLKEIAYNKEINLEFVDNPEAITIITKKYWGLFDVAIVTSQIKNERFQKIGLLGTQNSKRDALYLKDNNQSLVLVGETKITGSVSLPREGVKGGNISGVSYYGNRLIYGNKIRSTSALPKIKNIEYLKRIYQNYRENTSENFELEDNLKLQQSFISNTLIYESNKSIILSNMSLSGNIMIVSKTAITVNPSAILEDVILIAPTITIESKTEGNFQAFATKNIKIQSGCQLQYPTTLVLLEKEIVNTNLNLKEKEVYQIKVEKDNDIKGIIMSHSMSKSTNYNPQISIEENAVITGEVYCMKNLELKGTVLGSVYANNFIANQSGGIYINHIYNGVINSKKLPIQYAGLQINQCSNTVVKWVD